MLENFCKNLVKCWKTWNNIKKTLEEHEKFLIDLINSFNDSISFKKNRLLLMIDD